MTQATAEVVQLQVGDTVPIGSALVTLIIMGIVTDVNNPNMFGASLQSYGSQAVLTVPVLQGIKGNPGNPQSPLNFQNDSLSSPADLPTGLNDTTDLAKYWVFGVTDQNGNVVATDMYVWYGTTIGFKSFPIGQPGPPGASPLITPQIIREEPGNGNGPNGADSWIAVQGTVSNPTFVYHIAAPQGDPGPAGQLNTCPDIDFVTAGPNPGDTLKCSARVLPGAPIGLTILPSGTGGTLAAGSWFYVITSTMSHGESLQSNEVEATTVGTTSSVVLNWVQPSGGGAIGYKVYRGNTALGISTLIGTVTNPATTTFTDTGISGTPASPPSVGVVAGRSIWVPSSQVPTIPLLYTIPQSAFMATSGIGGAKQPVCTFAVPQQPWPWKPYVVGSMKIFGLNISFSPLLVGAEVLLGNATTGTLVASGEGNSLGAVSIIPNSSNTSNQSQAMTPTNNIGLVPPNHQGNQGTIYVSLVQQGMAGTYDYNPAGSRLAVLVLPTPDAGA